MALTRPRYSQIYDSDYKQSVRVATTTDVGNLLATDNMTNSVDGVTLIANDRVLVKDQQDGKQNGIYYVSSAGTGSNGTWIRSQDADNASAGKITAGMTTIVTAGAVNSGKTFRLTTADPITVGTTSLTFSDPFGAASAGGGNSHVQFNDLSSLGGTVGFTFNKYSNAVSISGNISSGNVNGVSSVHYANIGVTTSKVYQFYNASTNSLDTVFG